MNDTTQKNNNGLKQSKYLIPVITIILTLVVTLSITVITKSIMSTGEKANVSIADNSAEESFYNKNYEKSINEYEKLQEKDPWPIWTVKMAEIYSIKSDYIKSNELLRNAYDSRNKIIDSNKEKYTKEQDAQLVNEIVFNYLMNNEYKSAMEYGELFLMDYPSDKALIKTMFTVYMANNNMDKAKEILSSYEVDKENAKDLVCFAKMNDLTGNVDEALNLLKEAWDKDADEISIFDAVTEFTRENYSEVLKKVSALETKNPDEAVYTMWKADIYLNNKKYDKAKELLEKLDDSEADNINFKLLKADMYEKMGDSEECEDILKEIIHNNEEIFIGYYAAVLNEYNNGNYDKALSQSKKLILSDRDYVYGYAALVPQIFSKQEKPDLAEPYFRKALIKEPFNTSLICQIAEYYTSYTDTNNAFSYYTIASELEPKNSEIYYNMALIKIKNQRNDEAVKLLKTSIKLDDNKAKYYRALGSIYLTEKKNDDALDKIRQAYAIDEKDILTLNNAAYYYMLIDNNIDRAMTNIKAAYDGINTSTSEEQKGIITDNYNKIKAIYDDHSRIAQIPELKLFY